MNAFFGAWSLFNLFYYPHLDQWVSTVGASLMAISNTTYVMLVIYYIHKEKKESITPRLKTEGLAQPTPQGFQRSIVRAD